MEEDRLELQAELQNYLKGSSKTHRDRLQTDAENDERDIRHYSKLLGYKKSKPKDPSAIFAEDGLECKLYLNDHLHLVAF